MARKRVKKRTHVGAHKDAANGPAKSNPLSRTPKSIVIRIGAGEVGPSVSQLVKDVRQMIEPNTAVRLKERRSNRLRDYTTMAGPLGVSHLLLFSRSTSGNMNFRLAITPRGPTLHFRVEKYSLCKDIAKSQKHPKHGGNKEHLTAPLLVMNNFTSPSTDQPSSSSQKIPRHLESLATSVFQSLFPPISPQTTPLSSIRRVLLLNREIAPTSTSPSKPDSSPSSSSSSQSYILNLRHYAITTKRTGLSRPVRRLNAASKLMTSKQHRKGGLPNLGRLDDVADYLLDPGAGNYTSGSESEIETDAEVEVLETPARRVLSRQERQRAASSADSKANGVASRSGKSGSAGNVEKRAVKLVELGPRMTLRLMKVEEGVCQGKVMWHENIEKSKGEVRRMDEVWEQRRKEKEARRKEQRENVERKRREREAKGGGGEGEVDGEGDEDMDDDEWDSEGLDAEAEPEGGAGGEEEDEGEDEVMEDRVEEEMEDEDEG